jgi:PAS domain S-box-containing protein
MSKKKATSASTDAPNKTEPQISPELRSTVHTFLDNAIMPPGSRVAPDYTAVVDRERRYVEVSDSFCKLVGYTREQLIGKKYDDLTAPNTNDIPTVFSLFLEEGYMHGLWMLVHRTGTRILIRYESWVRPDSLIESNMELVGAGY